MTINKRFIPAAGEVTMFSTTWCGYCRILKNALDREGIAYQEINIEEDTEAEDAVLLVNRGNATVPTVVFPDGSAATNPGIIDVIARLGAKKK